MACRSVNALSCEVEWSVASDGWTNVALQHAGSRSARNSSSFACRSMYYVFRIISTARCRLLSFDRRTHTSIDINSIPDTTGCQVASVSGHARSVCRLYIHVGRLVTTCRLYIRCTRWLKVHGLRCIGRLKIKCQTRQNAISQQPTAIFWPKFQGFEGERFSNIEKPTKFR